jgi:secreted protein with Ig-like and vWFA domain
MKHDDNNPSGREPIDTELEARVVAWVSGEASAFEVAELERLTRENPELAIFKRRIEAVRGLVAEAIRPDPEPLLLSPERRAKLLAAISAPEAKAMPDGSTSAKVAPMAPAKKARRTDVRWLYAIAACLTIGLFTAISIPSFQKVRQSDWKEKAPAHTGLLLTNADGADADQHPMPMRALAMPEVSGFAKAEMRRENRSTAFAFNQARDELAKKREIERAARGGQAGAFAGKLTDSLSSPVAPPAEPGNQTIVLSPFAVSAPASSGYAAASTLAGSRVRSDLKDAGSAVSVVTEQFLQDTGAANKQQNLNYADAKATDGEGGNYGQQVAAQSAQNTSDDRAVKLDAFEIQGSAVAGNVAKSASTGVAASPAPESNAPAGQKEKSESDRTEPDLPLPPPVKTEPAEEETPEVSAAKQPVSTFSLHVSDVSFRLAQAALAKNESLDEASIRPEEFYNAFDYGDPAPTMAEKVSCHIEQSAHPFLQQRNLVRIALKVAATGRDAAQPLRLTVLLDTSGSMEREDRAAIARRALGALTSLLGPNDRLTLIGFARQPRLLAESLPGDKAAQVLAIMAHTPAEGGTNLEEALKLGDQLAQRHFEPAAQNRIVLLTDGAANLGNANPAQLAASIEALRRQGIAFDACGVGLDGLDDAMLERLTRQGAGRYYVLNSPEDAAAGFARQLAGAFHPAAENVKLQVRFNPARVGNYRLIGFEQHRLREEDFRNDSVAAASLAGEEAAVAVYQVEALPQGDGELGEVYVRFRDPTTGSMVERSWTLSYDAHAPAFDQASPTMQLAGTAALLAEKLHGGEAGEAFKLGDLAPVVNKLHSDYAGEPRVQELVTMFEQMRRLEGE